MSVTSANRDLSLLHPAMRTRVTRLVADITASRLPFRVFEAWRSPERQRYLYAQGRTRPGSKVTYAQAWESYHQYGLAVDIVGFVDNQWTWNVPPDVWGQIHEMGAAQGLEPLGFEAPHLQLADLKIGDLIEGDLPEGGDASWRDNLASAAAQWGGEPPAPLIDGNEPTRPPLAAWIGGELDWSKTRGVYPSDWLSMFGGQRWRYDEGGVYLVPRMHTPLRSAGAPLTCQTILDLYGPQIYQASLAHGIAPELIVMTIATETAFARKAKFTGPTTFRWEPHVEVTDTEPPTLGDYSVGPMQTLATTARQVIRRRKLPAYPAPFAIAPSYVERPDPAPADHPLYDPATNIDLGTAEIRHRTDLTGDDPILVAAAYNAGGLYESDRNVWRLRSHGDHIDRAARWFGDACFVLSSLRQAATS